MNIFNNETKMQKNVRITAGVFLVVILILIFFSNTIDNYNLPEVQIEKISEKSISEVLRIQGKILPYDPYNIMAEDTIKINSVNFLKGDYVKEGDVIYTLDIASYEDSKEPEENKKAYDDLKKQYDLMLIDNCFTKKEIEAIENINAIGTDDLLSKLRAMAQNSEIAEADLEKLKNELSVLEDEKENQTKTYETVEEDQGIYSLKSQINELEYTVTTLGNEETKLAEELSNAEEEYEKTLAKENNEADVSGNNNNDSIEPELPQNIKDIKTQLNDIKNKKYDKVKELESLKYELSQKELLIEEDKKKSETSENSIADKYDSKNKEVEVATEKADTISKEYEALKKKSQGLIEAQDLYKKLLEAEAKCINDDKENVIKAPVSGEIISIPFVSGSTIEKGEIIASIIKTDSEYYMEGRFDSHYEELLVNAEKLEIDQLSNNSNVSVEIKNINMIPGTTKEKSVVFRISGLELTESLEATITILGKNISHNQVIPIAAVREDAMGKYFLKVENKKTIFGDRYYAEKVLISELGARDDQQVAIEAMCDSNEYAITYSSSPISVGERIKLSNENN